MILNDHDMVVGASFENGTVQDYVDENNTYGLIRIEKSTANWFLFNEEDSDEISKQLYSKVMQEEHFIQDDFGEKIVLFNKNGDVTFEDMVSKIDEYLNDGMGGII
ncbi:MAG: hypothetical protein U9N30_02380 [Campylobacterota bacterium]|nr:hypothetical protein [Campylobacterota bacterium]